MVSLAALAIEAAGSSAPPAKVGVLAADVTLAVLVGGGRPDGACSAHPPRRKRQ